MFKIAPGMRDKWRARQAEAKRGKAMESDQHATEEGRKRSEQDANLIAAAAQYGVGDSPDKKNKKGNKKGDNKGDKKGRGKKSP